MTIETPEGKMVGNIGDWLVTGYDGKKYICKDELFQLIYEPQLPIEKYEEIEIIFAKSLCEFIAQLEISGNTQVAQWLRGWMAWKTVRYFQSFDGDNDLHAEMPRQ